MKINPPIQANVQQQFLSQNLSAILTAGVHDKLKYRTGTEEDMKTEPFIIKSMILRTRVVWSTMSFRLGI
jgi:hypothetical protein